jgi:hypothetical protein
MSKPKPTPPQETSAAQTGTSVSTAIANAFLTNANENTPDGSKTYEQSGSYSYSDPYTGQSYTVPRFTMNQTLSPQQTAIKGQQDAASLNLAKLGNNLSGSLGQQLTGNFKIDNESTESRLFELGRKRLDPLVAQRDEELRTRLANQGIKAGSSAYDRELNTFNQGSNDAYNQLLLTGRGQATQEQLTEDNQRINQISALLNGGQVSQPNFLTNNSVSPIPTTDNASIIANYDQQMMERAKMQNAGFGSALSGLGGLFSLSDENAKENIEPLGTVEGHKVYSYDYKGPFDDGQKHIGVMAQEAEKKDPSAVITGPDGFKRVAYGKLFGVGA